MYTSPSYGPGCHCVDYKRDDSCKQMHTISVEEENDILAQGENKVNESDFITVPLAQLGLGGL